MARFKRNSRAQKRPARLVREQTPIERIFEKYMHRKMTTAEKRLFHLKPEWRRKPISK